MGDKGGASGEDGGGGSPVSFSNGLLETLGGA